MPRPAATSHDDLVAVARDLLAAGGVPALSTRALARGAGVSAGTPYRYFTDKDALLLAVATTVESEFVTALELAAPIDTALPPALPAIARTLVDLANRTPELAHLLALPPHLSPALRGEGITAWISRRVAAAQQAGQVLPGDPDLVAHAAFGLVRGVLAVTGSAEPTAQQRVITNGIAGLLGIHPGQGPATTGARPRVRG